MKVNGVNLASVQGTQGIQGTIGTQGVITQGVSGSNGIQGVTNSSASVQGVIGTGIGGYQSLYNLANTNTLWPTAGMSGGVTSVVAVTANRLYALPFIPSRTITYSGLLINNNTLVGSNFARILVYSDLNGFPNTKLYESTDIACNTTGIKTVSTSGTFLAGVTYWLCVYANAAVPISRYNISSVLPLKINIATSPPTFIYSYYIDVTYGSAPSTFGTPTIDTGAPIMVAIAK